MLYISQQSQQKKIRHISAILFQLTNKCVYHLTPQKVYGCKIRLNRVNSPHPPPYHPSPLPARVELYRVYCTKLIVSHQLDTSIKRKRQFLVCLRQTRVFKFEESRKLAHPKVDWTTWNGECISSGGTVGCLAQVDYEGLLLPPSAPFSFLIHLLPVKSIALISGSLTSLYRWVKKRWGKC